MLLGAVGCIGAWFEKKVLLFTVTGVDIEVHCIHWIFLKYIITMIIIFVALLFGVVFVIAFNERVRVALAFEETLLSCFPRIGSDDC
jgi:NhaP-type Na+/H+ or K+/H+ antiporter